MTVRGFAMGHAAGFYMALGALTWWVSRQRPREAALLAEGEAALLDAGGDLRATVLKVAHHGSATSSADAFLAAVRPLVSVISVGEDNSFRHPSPSTLDKLDSTVLYRTDENGRVRLSTDGRSLRIDLDRGEPTLPSASQAP